MFPILDNEPAKKGTGGRLRFRILEHDVSSLLQS